MIKVGYIVSYDYALFFTSVKPLYNYVDKIFIAIDNERKTWSGNQFEIPDSFFDKVNEFDVKNKIQFYFDNFYVANLSPIDCETRERNMLLKKMGKGWLIQLDVDEYIYDFKSISKYLRKYWYLTIFPKFTPIVFKGKWVTLFRQLPDGYLFIENDERFSFISNLSNYTHTRNNNTVRNHFSNINVIHQSWARTDDEIQMKIKNWGHRDDFDTVNFFEFWQTLNSSNYKNHKNFHPILPVVWDKLNFIPSNSVDDFIVKYSLNNKQVLNHIKIKTIFKALLNKIIG